MVSPTPPDFRETSPALLQPCRRSWSPWTPSETLKDEGVECNLHDGHNTTRTNGPILDYPVSYRSWTRVNCNRYSPQFTVPLHEIVLVSLVETKFFRKEWGGVGGKSRNEISPRYVIQQPLLFKEDEKEE